MPDLKSHPALQSGSPGGDLAVIACHFNPCGYQRPVENLRRFLDGMQADGAPVFLTELTFDDQPPVLPENSSRVLQVRTTRSQTLWEKESLLTAAARRLPPQFTKVAWVDADILFSRRDWVSAASVMLDEHPLIQLFSRAIFTDAAGRERGLKSSVGHAAALRHPNRDDWRTFHPGFAWAARRELFSDSLGGLYYCPASRGDSILALAAMGRLHAGHPCIREFNPAVLHAINSWASRLPTWTRLRLTCLRGDVTHLWHGEFKNRDYAGRAATIADIDPAADLHTDRETGLTTWTAAAQARKPQMIAAVRDHFRNRQEDTVPV